MHVGQLFLDERTLPRIDIINILSHVLAVSKERLLMETNRQLTAGELAVVQKLIAERRKGKPLAYLTNHREFFSEDFYVDERVLIPRPETELLVDEALHLIRERANPTRALDMGTGSGIIGIMLAKGGAEEVVCVDISIGAITVARKNSRLMQVEDHLLFLVSDLFSGMTKDARAFDIICANLPYIPTEDYANLMEDVRCFEPREALVGGRGGMEVYRRFAHELKRFLRPGGSVLCEIDGPQQSEAIADLLWQEGLQVAVRNDLSGRERVVEGTWTDLS